MTPLALGGACVINTLMLVFALADLSADLHATRTAQLDFLVAYGRWRGAAPLVAPLLAMLLVPLPLVLANMLRDGAASALGWRSASALRHAADVAQPLVLALLLSLVFGYVNPSQEELFRACPREGAACAAAAAALTRGHAGLLALNLAMLLCDVAKFAGNRQGALEL